MGRIKIDYGIDLGTTNSALAFVNKGEIEVREIERSKIVPSCVAYDRKGNVSTGLTAINKKPNHLEFKRKMGTDWTKQKHPDFNEQVNAEELSAEILKKLKGDITEEQFKSVVITVPAMFDMNQVAATKRAGELAGFEQVEILMEPVAAAFAYGLKNNLKDGKFVVFDFGGGTFDAALVHAQGGVMSVVSSEGDNNLGGKDLDNLVVNQILVPLLQEKYVIDNRLSDPKENNLKDRLKTIADTLKIDLGKNESFDILTDLDELGLDDAGKEIEIEKTFTREEVYSVMKVPFMQAIDHAKKLLKVNNISVDDLKAFVLVGGPTQIPLFRTLIEKELTKPDTSLNPMTAIAEGAALYAATFNNKIDSHGAPIGITTVSGEVASTIELDVQYSATSVQNEEAVGIKRKNTSENFSIIIERNDGWISAKYDLDDVIMVPIKSGKPNSFVIKLYDSGNNPVICTPSEFTVLPDIDVDAGAPLGHNIGMEIFHEKKGLVFTPFKGLEKDKILPLTGKTDIELYNQSQLRPGNKDDVMKIPIYYAERDARDSRSIINIYGDTIEINGMDVEKLVPENSLAEFTLTIDLSQNLTLEAEFPQLDMDIIKKTIKFPPKAAVKKEQIDALFSEIKKGVSKLSKSTETVSQLDDFKSKQSYYNIEFTKITDSEYEKLFGDLRSFLLEIDIALENIQWPILKKEIVDALFDLELLVKACINKSLEGWEKDKGDLEYYTKQKEQLFNMSKPDQNLAEELIENIKSAFFNINIRHDGKKMFTAWINDFNNRFSSIEWKNSSIARQEINRGLELITSGADKDSLESAVRAIVSQMENPDIPAGGGGVKS